MLMRRLFLGLTAAVLSAFAVSACSDSPSGPSDVSRPAAVAPSGGGYSGGGNNALPLRLEESQGDTIPETTRAGGEGGTVTEPADTTGRGGGAIGGGH
jgi:hypothetical protein